MFSTKLWKDEVKKSPIKIIQDFVNQDVIHSYVFSQSFFPLFDDIDKFTFCK